LSRDDRDGLLGVRLEFGAGGVEGGKLAQGGIHRGDSGEAIEGHLEAAGIVDLGDEADVGERHPGTEGIGAGPDQRLDGLEADDDPVLVPGLHGSLVGLEHVAEVVERADIVQRVDVAGDDLGDGAHLRAVDRIRRQQGRFPMDLVEILDDGEGLQQHLSGQRQHRHPFLRIDRVERGGVLAAAILGEVDRHGLEGQAFDVQGDPHAIGGGGAEKRIEFMHLHCAP
jgi:hypothetical protein